MLRILFCILFFFEYNTSYCQFDSIINAIPKNKQFDKYLIIKQYNFYIILDADKYLKRQESILSREIKKESNESINYLTEKINCLKLYSSLEKIFYIDKNDCLYPYNRNNLNDVNNYFSLYSFFLFKKAVIIDKNYQYIKYRNQILLKDLSICVIPKYLKLPKDSKKRGRYCITRIPI